MHSLFTIPRLFLFTLLLNLSLSATAQDSSIKLKIIEVESQLTPLLENNNVDGLDKLMHPEFTVQSAEGSYLRKAPLLDNFRNGRNPYLKFRPQADSFVIVNENMVITSGKETFAHKAGEMPGKDQVRFFYHVWIKHNDQWLLTGRMIAAIPKK